jgi:hypothetical protein
LQKEMWRNWKLEAMQRLSHISQMELPLCKALANLHLGIQYPSHVLPLHHGSLPTLEHPYTAHELYCTYLIDMLYSRQRCNFFVYSAIASPQLGGSTCAIAIQQLLKEMLLRNFAIAIFSEVRNFQSATW